jgi:hypothetical protein
MSRYSRITTGRRESLHRSPNAGDPSPNATQVMFGSMPRSRIALEIGMHSPRISRLLSGLGHQVIVAHARNMRFMGESRRKDDRLDAQRSRVWQRSIAVAEEWGALAILHARHRQAG